MQKCPEKRFLLRNNGLGEKWINWTHYEVERLLSCGVRPDITLWDDINRPVLCIEVVHSHNLESTTIEKLKQNNLPWFAIRADEEIMNSGMLEIAGKPWKFIDSSF